MNTRKMRGPVLSLLFAAVFCLPVFGEEIPEPWFNTLKITYRISMRPINPSQADFRSDGTKVVYIDAVNNKRREKEEQLYRQVSRKGRVMERDIQTLRIQTEEKHYAIYWPEKNIAYYFDVKGGFYAWIDFEWRTINRMTYVGTQFVMGKECKYYESETEKIWLWNSIVLKKEDTSEVALVALEAIEILEDPKIDSTYFELPGEVEEIKHQ